MLARMRCSSSIRRLSLPTLPWTGLSNSFHDRKFGHGALGSPFEFSSNSLRTLLSTVSLIKSEPGSSEGNLCPLFRSGREVDGQVVARQFAAQASRDTYAEEVDDINSKFAEARDDIEMALESKETVYFDAEAETARTSVKAVLDKYEALLARLDQENRGVVQRSMGLKMEQLKAELKQLELD